MRMPLSRLFWHMAHCRRQSGEHMCVFYKGTCYGVDRRHTVWEKKSAEGLSAASSHGETWSDASHPQVQMLRCAGSGVLLNLHGALCLVRKNTKNKQTKKAATQIYTGILDESLQIQIPRPLSRPRQWRALFDVIITFSYMCVQVATSALGGNFPQQWRSLVMRASQQVFRTETRQHRKRCFRRRDSWSLMARPTTVGVKKSWDAGGNSPLSPADLPHQR